MKEYLADVGFKTTSANFLDERLRLSMIKTFKIQTIYLRHVNDVFVKMIFIHSLFPKIHANLLINKFCHSIFI
jgi:hypothetical protein